ncbi:hypothetical protein LAZ67_18001034 [Cordylochernes scorpioides]|uniref:Pro-Pol polyprotein n=1 Tax=Cordylochernes scorpioides TaxID=51811 RepID=A0ABY6LGC0_9ARAC|nr:hypothetical protein LAZ67_18001034 [Cordylochernes scorpioides]
MNQDDKEARVQEIGEFPNSDHGPTTPPPHLGTIILQLATILERLQPLHPRDLDPPAFDGMYNTACFFRNFNLQTQNLTPQQKLQKLPQYLVKQPLDLFRQLRLDAKPYEEAQRTLEDLFPDKTDTTYAKFFAAKSQHYNTLEEYFRIKTTLGMQLNLPRPVIIEALTEGLPTGDQRLVRVVPPKSLSEWYELTSRVRGNFSPQPPRGPENPPRMEGPYHNTPRPPQRAQNYAAIPSSPCKFCQGQHWHSQCQQRPASNAQHGQTYHANHHRQGTLNQANNGRQATPSTAPTAPTTSNTSPKQKSKKRYPTSRVSWTERHLGGSLKRQLEDGKGRLGQRASSDKEEAKRATVLPPERKVFNREWQECDKYEEEKFDIQQKVSVLRNPDKEETIPIASEDTVINVKLPELALKTYDGSLEGWLPWWAQFSKIHENNNLSDSDRFLYLRQAIVPNSEAYRVVASYPVTGANYALAVQALQERFGDPNILTELYVRRLLNSVISNVKKENRNLSSLYDELSSYLRSLEALGIDPQLSGIFLYPLVESSLPSDILKIWHRHPSSGYGLELAKREESDKGVGGAQERLRLLLDFLKAEVRSAQRLKFVEKGFKQEEPYKRSYNDGTRTRSNFRPATVSSLFGGRTNIKCFFCERTNHASHQCRSIMKMSPGERNDKIRSAHLCFKCLRKGHIQSQCREQLECKNCGRNHLEVLCEGNSSNRLTNPGREDLKENAPEPIASLSSQACTGQVLLMTTVALLRGPNASRRVRILLDSGSQFSYIKQSLVWSIGIERKGEITIAKSLFGGNKIGEEKHGKFMLELENLGNKRDVIHIEALDQRKICDAIPPLPKGDWLEKLKIKGIILSQDNFKGQEIDILIGANYLGMILTGKIVQVEADLTAVETKLGWTLMGNSPIIDSNDNVQQTLNLLTTRCDLKDLWDLEIFRDWLTEGLIERVEENPLERRGYYLPHRPVYKMESKTTPIRPVFDASCLGHNGLSLNQCLEKGPNLLERIPEMMIRFRENKFGVTADIRKAFQMVAIEESERNYLRFLWWEKESDRELIAYRHKRLVFGLNCSPFVLNAVIEYHLQSIRGPLVQWAKILAQSFYMDNCITSLETKQEVQEFQKAAIEIMDRAKMDLREWENSLGENPEKGTCTKILGVVWNKMEDSLKCKLPDNLSLQPILTKRLVLSMVQRIFDPLGFCAPVFLPPKLLLQRSWGLKLGWDTPLPESMAQEFRTWLDQIKFIELIKIPRYMWNDLIFPTEVHIFCDASQIGYGAVAYLRSETGRENTLTLIWSKVRLAPMKSITIPRLELMAMVLGARLANAIQAALKRKCETTLWSDSTTALSWIKREIEWRVFVRNRVREIQATTNLNDWRFVPSQLNPADLLSRGCPPSQFVQSRWWEGPEWLKKPKEFWPNSEFSINPKEIKVEENIMKTNINLNIDYKDWILTRKSDYSLNIRVPEEFKTPIILPGDHPFVEQLIWEVHLKNGHVGVQFILSKLREKFWIIRGRKTIKKIISPLHLKEGGKVWVAAFTCAVYRAIHLELVKSLETGVFMMALHRFICRRGRPEKIYSDNGTNFAKLNRIFKRLDWTRIERETSIKRIQWIFIPPSAPWWGGFWERMVRTIKEMLIKMLGHRKLKYVQLQTALCEIESIINNRPLTYVSEDDNDLKPLTPNELLQNGPESSFPEFENLKPEMLHSRYRELGQLKRELKQRFLKEYLGALIQKSENIDRRQLKAGDVVLIGQENLKRMVWPKGRIVNLIPGKDGIVRVAHVKTSTGTLIRALQRLHPLEISSNVKTIQMDNSNTEPQSDAFLGNRPNIESRDSRNRYGRVIRKPARRAKEIPYKQRLVDGKKSKKRYPTSRVSWTERHLGGSLKRQLEDRKGRLGQRASSYKEEAKRATVLPPELTDARTELSHPNCPTQFNLLHNYQHIFSENKFDVPTLNIPPVKINTTSDKIITLRPYRVPYCDLKEIQNQVAEMLKHNIIEKSYSPFASSVTLVTKRDKTKRFCIDYRKLNDIIQPAIHPLPLIDSVLDKLSRAKIFSSVDIASAYWQVEIAPESRPLLAFVTPDGQYQCTRLPFGLRNSPQIYERSISQIIQKHNLQHIEHYFDDFIIFSESTEEHIQHLTKFFEVCQAENIRLNYNKCEFFKTSIEFLGYTISAGTYTPQLRNLDTIDAIKPPYNKKSLQSFLGAINVYKKFIPNYARLRTPLNNLLKKNENWHWSDACILKQVHPNNQIHPVQFYSRALRPHEQNYNISELECLAIIESVEKFRIYLTGTKFTIFSDHHALQWLKSIKNPAGRLFRWSLRLSTYDYEIRYIKGTLQYEADLLSRNPFCGFLDADAIKIHQNNTPTHPHITQDTNGLHTITRKGVTKILIPEKLRNTLLNKVHLEYNHPGISQMSRLVSGQYHWSGMSRDIKNHVNSCTTCQLTKHPKGPTYGELGQTPSATKPFDLLSIDTVSGFTKYGNSKTHLHVIVDHMTRYAWTFPSKSTSTLTYIQAIKKVLVYGSPKRLLSDRAPAFTSEKFRRFLVAHGIQPLNTTSNNPQANGLCERLNSTITNKAHFSLNGEVNTRSSRIWATENPRILKEIPLHQPRVTVWCGFTSSSIIGPFFKEEIYGRTFDTVFVTGEHYVQPLREKVIPILQDRQALSEITFMQDGEPPHISRGAKQFLKDTFGKNRVISRHFIHQ